MFYYRWTIIYKETMYKVGQLGLQILVATVLTESSLKVLTEIHTVLHKLTHLCSRRYLDGSQLA